MTKTPDIAWTILEDSEGMDTVRLSADPIGRVIPEGVTVEVRVSNDRERRHRGEVEVTRGASVVLVGGEPVRFGTTPAKPSASARVEEGMRAGEWSGGDRTWIEYPKPVAYWRAVNVYANRADTNGWDDLPEGANHRFRDVVASAVAFVASELPHLWAGSDEVAAARVLASAEADMVKARAAVKSAKAELAKAKRAHDRATK